MTPDTISIAIPEGMNHTLALIIALIPVVCFFASLVVSPMNEAIRKKTDAGIKIHPVILTLVSILNFLAANGDKFKQQVQMAQGKVVIHTDPSTSAPAVPGGLVLTPDTTPTDTKPPAV